ncbi:MAG: VCBS repeat-containing protein [Bacteroidota bacterium]|nr:VCBS repeat-containing protein [Bacteroidota bacterium]
MRSSSGFSFVACLLGSLLFLSCRNSSADHPLFELMEHTGIDFNNEVRDGRLDNSFLFRNFYNGGGVAIGDINNDGLPDVFFTSNMGINKLYLNKGNFTFEDVTARAGFRQDSMWSTGVVFVDINNDGWLDIYVCNSGHMSDGNRRNKLYINNHDGTFTESAARYGLDISAYTTQVTFFDYDGDGDLDCFMINNSPIPVNTLNNANRRDLPDSAWPVRTMLKGGGDHLYRNDNGHFKEVTGQAGIHGTLISFGLGALVTDINGDGWPDVYVSNDSYERDYLYINQGNGTFRDELEDWMGHISMSSMGTDMADINNDGYPDLFTTDMLPGDDYRLKTTGSFDNANLFNSKLQSGFYYQYVKNCLQLNNRHGRFLEMANYAGVSGTDWSWGALLFDMDNDGYNDIYVCNGVNRDVTDLDFLNFFADDVYQKMALSGKKENIDDLLKRIPQTPLLNKVYRNLGNLSFADNGTTWGFTQASFSNGAAYGDLDNDGDLDLIVNNENGPAFVYQNNSRQINHYHYIGVSLRGNSPNTFAIGSKIRAYHGPEVFYRELVPSRGFQSSVDYKQLIGLGPIDRPDSLVITWPDGAITRLDHPAADSVYTLHQPVASAPRSASHAVPLANARPAAPLLLPLPSSFDRHQEDDNIDFNYEHNLPKMLSREGPRAACGDVNGDGLTDVYIGGTSQHPGQLYLQTADGRFIKSHQRAFDAFPDFEDEAVLFFDADHDGDLDLFIGPGGNNNPPYSRQMQLRLFLNDGKGNFTLDAEAFPPTSHGVNTAVAVAADFNGDGFPDLFVGGRSVPREYGSSPSSCLYINDGQGHFKDIAPDKNPDIAHIGMVTGAAWADLTGQGQPQLLIVGEWMAPRLFSWQHDHFAETPTNLGHLFGWWQTAAVADLNGDGLPDLVLGNIGENFYLRPDSSHPVKLWIADFDQNGIQDKILTRTLQGRDMPVFLKRDMEDQIPSLKKQNLRHAEYAKRSIHDLFPQALLDSAEVKRFDYPTSIIALNRGHGQFDVRPLPTLAQLSCIQAIRPIDLNGDGFTDLVMGGNESGWLPQFGRLDASFGLVLTGSPKGRFSLVDPDSSGLQLPGQIRDIVTIPGKDHVYLLFLRNDDTPALYQCTAPIMKQATKPDK